MNKPIRNINNYLGSAFDAIAKQMYESLFCKKDAWLSPLKSYIDNKFEFQIEKEHYWRIFENNFKVVYKDSDGDVDPGFYVEFSFNIKHIPISLFNELLKSDSDWITTSSHKENHICIENRRRLLYSIAEDSVY